LSSELQKTHVGCVLRHKYEVVTEVTKAEFAKWGRYWRLPRGRECRHASRSLGQLRLDERESPACREQSPSKLRDPIEWPGVQMRDDADLVLDDLQDVTLLLFTTRRRHQRPNRRGVRPAFADDLTEIFLCNTEFEHMRVLSDDLFDLNLIGLVD